MVGRDDFKWMLKEDLEKDLDGIHYMDVYLDYVHGLFDNFFSCVMPSKVRFMYVFSQYAIRLQWTVEVQGPCVSAYSLGASPTWLRRILKGDG